MYSCVDETQSDWVEFSMFAIGLEDRRYSRMCGTNEFNRKKTVRSDKNFLRVTFHSNDVYDATGFKAVYEFRDVEGKY